MILNLYSLSGDFKIDAKCDVNNLEQARLVVERHILNSGYTNLRQKDDGDDSIRFIADPPKGRKGRNVASIDIW